MKKNTAALKIEPAGTLYTPVETAAKLKMDVGTLAHWRLKGRGPRFVKNGGRILYSDSAIEAYLAASMRSSTSDEGCSD